MKYYWILLTCLISTSLTTMAHTYLQVICEPGVDIYLNDKLQGRSNWVDGGLHLKISPGEYDLAAKKAGYKSQTTTVSLKKSDVKLWELQPFAPLKDQTTAAATPPQTVPKSSGSLTIYSKPIQCEITLVSASGSVASWEKRKSRWHAQQIPPGKYTIKAKAQAQKNILSYDLEIHPAEGAVLYFDFNSGAASLRNVFEHHGTN